MPKSQFTHLFIYLFNSFHLYICYIHLGHKKNLWTNIKFHQALIMKHQKVGLNFWYLQKPGHSVYFSIFIHQFKLKLKCYWVFSNRSTKLFTIFVDMYRLLSIVRTSGSILDFLISGHKNSLFSFLPPPPLLLGAGCIRERQLLYHLNINRLTVQSM